MNTDQLAILIRIGAKIKDIRTGKGITVRDIEAYTGIDNSNFSKIENGKVTYSILTLIKIAEGLEVDISEFFI